MRIEKVGFPWACLNSFTNIINADQMPSRIIINDFHVHSKCCEIAYRFYNSGVMNESAVDYIGDELRQAHGKPTFSIRTTLLYHCVGSSLFNIEFTDQSAVFNVCKMSLSIRPDVLCYVLGKAMAILPFSF